MKRRNPIGVLVRLRGIREERARRALGRASQEEVRAEGVLASRQAEYRDRPAPPAELSPVELRALQLQGMRSYELLTEASAEYQRALEQVEEARRAWRRSRDELEAAERLERRRREEAARRARVAAQRALDQLVLTLRGRQPWK